jgi:phosphate transport system substrate-binding protein
MNRLTAAIALLLTWAGPCQAQGQHAAPVRIWGQATMQGVVERLVRSFQALHPAALFEVTLKGSATAIPGLYSGKADIALLGREDDLVDDNGFGRVRQYKPLRLELMSGSFDSAGKSDALVVFVRRDNPLRRLTLAQLDSLFGCERRRSGGPIRTWGDLGLQGTWRQRPIALHMYAADSGTGIFFQHVVMKDSRKMNWDRIREYRNSRGADGTLRPAAEQIAAAVRRDRFAMGLGNAHFLKSDLAPVAIAAGEQGAFVSASPATVVARTYPLARRAYAFVDKKPGTPLDPAVAEFLRFVLSNEGQAAIAREGGFLPLGQAALAQQRKLLEGAVK